jgi:hypothetical protein
VDWLASGKPVAPLPPEIKLQDGRSDRSLGVAEDAQCNHLSALRRSPSAPKAIYGAQLLSVLSWSAIHLRLLAKRAQWEAARL